MIPPCTFNSFNGAGINERRFYLETNLQIITLIVVIIAITTIIITIIITIIFITSISLVEQSKKVNSQISCHVSNQRVLSLKNTY